MDKEITILELAIDPQGKCTVRYSVSVTQDARLSFSGQVEVTSTASATLLADALTAIRTAENIA